MTIRRKFSVADQLAIVQRATDASGRVHCQGCGIWVKRRKDYELDHILAEGMRPAADSKRRLVAADGQILCTDCHGKKTRRDKRNIAGAKRVEAYDLGLQKPGKQKIRRPEEPERRPTRVANGVCALMRRGFVPAGKS